MPRAWYQVPSAPSAMARAEATGSAWCAARRLHSAATPAAASRGAIATGVHWTRYRKPFL